MDWRDQLHASLKATEANLARLQGNSAAPSPYHIPHPSFAGGIGASLPHANRPQPFVHSSPIGLGAVGGASGPSSPSPSLAVLYQEHNESIIALRSSVRSLGAEMDLERQAREDHIRELSRRTLNESAELREAVRQLREDNHDLRRTVQALERRALLNPQSRARGDVDDATCNIDGASAHTSNIALLPRVADLEQLVQQLQNQLQERKVRTSEIVRDAITSFGEEEMQKMRSVAREAARESTDEYIRVRTEALQQTFSVHLDTARHMHEKSAAAVQTLEQRMSITASETAAVFHRMDERIDSALEAKEKWMHMATEVHDMVRTQLDAERARADETLRILRAEVSTATKRASQESLDTQHTMQHFVNQRLDGIQTLFMTRDEVSKMLQTNLNQLEQGLTAARTYWNAAKQQFDDGRAETLRQLQSHDGKWSELRAAVDDLVIQRQTEAQLVQRLRSAVDDMQQRVKQAYEAAETVSLKQLDTHNTLEQIKYSTSERDRETKSCVESLNETVKRLAQDHANTATRLQTQAQRMEQQLALQQSDVGAAQQQLDALHNAVKDMPLTWRKQLSLSISESEEAAWRKFQVLVSDTNASSVAALRASIDTAQREVTANSEQAIRRVSTDLEEAIRSAREHMTDAMQSALQNQSESLKRSVAEQQRVAIQKVTEQTSEMVESRVAAAVGNQFDVVAIQRENMTRIRDEVQKQLRNFSEDEELKRLQAVEKAVAPIHKELSLRREAIESRAAEKDVAIEREVERAKQYISSSAEAAVATIRSLLSTVDQRSAALKDDLNAANRQASPVVEASEIGKRMELFEESLRRLETEMDLVRSLKTTLKHQTEEFTASSIAAARGAWMLDVEVRWDALSQSLRKQMHESGQGTIDSIAVLRGMIHDVDERVTTHIMSCSSPTLPRSASVTNSAPPAVSMNAVRELMESKKTTWIDPLIAAVEGIQHRIDTIFGNLEQIERQQGLLPLRQPQQQLQQQVDACEVDASEITSLIEEKMQTAVACVEEQLLGKALSRFEVILQTYDEQAVQSLEALDSKINALAEAFSNREDEKQWRSGAATKRALQLLRDADSFFNHTHNTTSSSSTTDQSRVNPAAATDSNANDASSHDDSILVDIAQRVAQCCEAIQAISMSTLDTVDLVQRHEQGFASINELVQAILFNASNIVTLAEAVGLDREAFALQLNYPDYVTGTAISEVVNDGTFDEE